MLKQDEILKQILREAGQAPRRTLAVFDLDSTLFDLSLRISRILDAFVAVDEHRRKFPHECAGLDRVEIRPTDWGLGEPLRRAGLHVSPDSQFFRELHAFWADCFFSDDYLHHDEPLPGAVEYVKLIEKAGADIMYLTGRDVPRMWTGTEKSLRARGFPIDEHARLVLKPQAELDDAQFKVDVLKDLTHKYERIWLFENEPLNLNLCERECPSIGLIFIETTHSGRETLTAKVHRIRSFEI